MVYLAYNIILVSGVQHNLWEWSESESCSVMSDSLWPHGLYSPWNSLGQNTGVGSLSFLQGMFPTQGSNPGFPHCRQILYQLDHKGSPSILECVAYPFSKQIFQTQESNWGPLHCRQIFYQPSYSICIHCKIYITISLVSIHHHTASYFSYENF